MIWSEASDYARTERHHAVGPYDWDESDATDDGDCEGTREASVVVADVCAQ